MRFSTIHNILDDQLEFEINYCGIANHDSAWFEERNKPTYSVWIVNAGNVCIKYNERFYSLDKGDCIFFRPDVSYKAWTESEEGCSFMFILFEVYIGRSLTSTDVLQTEGMLKAERIKNETEIIFNCYKNYENNSHRALLHLKSAAIFLITKVLAEARTGTVTIPKGQQEKVDNMKTVLQYINDNILNEITVKELADTLHMSEKYFITYFKNIIGLTPFSYITSIKMKKAYEYIGAKGYSVKQTADILGYSD